MLLKILAIFLLTNSTLRKIEDDTLKNTNLTSIGIPETINEIGISAFENTNLKGVLLLPNVSTINQNAFIYSKKLTVDSIEKYINHQSITV